MLHGPILLKFLIYASLDSFGPRLAVTHSACLHGSRCVGAGRRSFHNRSISDRSLHDRSCHSSGVRLTGASGRGVHFLLQLPAGLTRCHLGPPRQWNPRQVETLMEVALLSHQSVVIAPLLYPSHKISEPVEAEARGPPEMFFYVWHVLHWASFLDTQCLLLVREEVREELIPEPYPFCLPKGGGVILIVDPEHMLKVLLPPCAMEFGSQLHRITGRSPWPTTRLRRGTFRCLCWNILCYPGGEITLLTRWLHTHLFWHPPGATGRLATISPPSSCQSPMVL